MAVGTYILEVDWDGDGVYCHSASDVTGDVITIQTRTGRDFASQLTGRAAPGSLTVILDNRTGKYSPFQSSSAIFQDAVPGREVRLRTTSPSCQTLWSGFLDEIIPSPRLDGGHTAELRALGPLSKLEEPRISVESQTTIATGAALADVLDAADWPDPNSYDTEVNADSPVGYWRFGETSGDAQDETVNNNDGTIAGAGTTQGVTGLLDGDTNLAIEFDGATSGSRVDFGNGGVLDNIFDSGGTIECFINPDSDGQNDFGYIWDKSNYITVLDESDGAMKLRFQQNFSGNDGIWTTTNRVITVGKIHHIAVVYDSDSNTNDPTFYIDGCPLTVGSGLDETVPAPSGTRTSDAASTMYVGNRDTGNRTFDGTIDEFAMYSSELTAARIAAHYLSGANQRRDLDTGQTVMDRWLVEAGEEGEPALQAAHDLAESEARGFLRETRDGKIAFEDRHHRLKAPHTTSQATFTDVPGTANPSYFEIVPESAWEEVYNELIAKVQRQSVGSSTALWTLPESGANSPPLDSGQSITIEAFYPPAGTPAGQGVDGWITPAVGTDITANSQADGGGTNLNGNITVTAVSKGTNTMRFTINNTSSPRAFLTLVQARGSALTKEQPTNVIVRDATSITAYGLRTFPVPSKYISNINDAKSYCDWILSIYKDPIPVVSILFPATKDSVHLTQAITRDVSDRITINSDERTGLGISGDYFIEAMTHHIRDQGTVHIVGLECSPVGNTGFGPGWILDTSELGTDTVLNF